MLLNKLVESAAAFFRVSASESTNQNPNYEDEVLREV
jgi:hypothetical protein